MICKYCGKESDNNTEICSVCRDMLGVEEAQTEPAYEAGPEAEAEFDLPLEEEPKEQSDVFIPPSKMKHRKKEKAPKEPREPKTAADKKDMIPMLAVILCALCLVVSVFSVYTAVKMRSELGEAITFATKAQNDKIAELEARLAPIEAQAQQQQAEAEAAAQAEAKNFKIISAPGDETREAGYRSQPDHYLFGMIVEGPVQYFQWEKKLADGSFVPVEFDENHKSAAFGLSLLESTADGFSKLIAEGLTPQSSGTYRCIAINPLGMRLEASVNLNIK